MATPLRAEQDWARRYPVPESSEEDILLSLWNYPVAKTDLSPEHRAALTQFLAGEFLQLSLARGTSTQLFVRGHASDSGDEAGNLALSRTRAEKVVRYLVSAGFPVRQVRAEWAGSSEPADPGTSGFSAARNRRVEVVRFAPSEPVPRPPVDIIDLPPPAPTPAPKPIINLPALTMSGATYERTFPIDFPTYRSPDVIVTGSLQAILKGKITDKGDGFTGGVAFKSGGVSAKAEAEIADHVKAKFAAEWKDNEPGLVFKGGAEFSDVRFKPEIGLQFKETFLYVTFTLIERPMPDLEVDGLHVTGNVTVKGTISFAPGPALLAKLAAAAPQIAVAMLPVIVAALVLAATVAGIEAAKAEQLRFARLIAVREGIAARVAYEIVGNAAEAAFRERRLEWRKTDEGLEKEFIDGVNAVNSLLKTEQAREAKKDEWTKSYSADGNLEFTTLKQRVYEKVGNYEREGSLDDALGRL